MQTETESSKLATTPFNTHKSQSKSDSINEINNDWNVNDFLKTPAQGYSATPSFGTISRTNLLNALGTGADTNKKALFAMSPSKSFQQSMIMKQFAPVNTSLLGLNNYSTDNINVKDNGDLTNTITATTSPVKKFVSMKLVEGTTNENENENKSDQSISLKRPPSTPITPFLTGKKKGVKRQFQNIGSTPIHFNGKNSTAMDILNNISKEDIELPDPVLFKFKTNDGKEEEAPVYLFVCDNPEIPLIEEEDFLRNNMLIEENEENEYDDIINPQQSESPLNRIKHHHRLFEDDSKSQSEPNLHHSHSHSHSHSSNQSEIIDELEEDSSFSDLEDSYELNNNEIKSIENKVSKSIKRHTKYQKLLFKKDKELLNFNLKYNSNSNPNPNLNLNSKKQKQKQNDLLIEKNHKLMLESWLKQKEIERLNDLLQFMQLERQFGC